METTPLKTKPPLSFPASTYLKHPLMNTVNKPHHYGKLPAELVVPTDAEVTGATGVGALGTVVGGIIPLPPASVVTVGEHLIWRLRYCIRSIVHTTLILAVFNLAIWCLIAKWPN